MRIFFAEEQNGHDPEREFVMGDFRPAMDRPSRAKAIFDSIEMGGLGTVERPRSVVSERVLHGVHDPGLLDFLKNLHHNWASEYPGTDPFPEMGLAPGMRRRLSESLRGKLVYYCFDTCSAVGPKTWESAIASLATAVAGVEAIAKGQRVAFSLCRPPGHHAGSDFYGGYCYLNNIAVAAQTWLELTGTRCAILDVDFHHGNGTQEIFYERSDVYFASIHRSPAYTYPFFSGFADERGAGAGLGWNVNYPLSRDTSWARYESALVQALDGIRKSGSSALLVSLGVDTYSRDPVGGLGLDIEDFEKMGSQVASERMPTLILMEGGYAPEAAGKCVVSFLRAFA